MLTGSAGVLGLQLPQPLGLAGLHPAVLAPPAVPGRLGDLQHPQDLGQVLAVVEQPLALADLTDSLLRGMPMSLHRDRPPAHSLGYRTLTADGPTSRAHVRVTARRWSPHGCMSGRGAGVSRGRRG